MEYSEDSKSGNEYRKEYLSSINRLICERRRVLLDHRMALSKDIIEKCDEYRNILIDMLGWPLTDKVHAPLSVREKFIAEENGVRIFRVQFEIFKDFYWYGVLLKNKNDKLPLVIAQHGGLGTPELCSGLLSGGTANYNDMVEKILNRGVHVFAPQMLLWDKDTYGIKYDRLKIDAELKQVGGSISAIEIYCLRCCMSYFESREYVNKDKIGMVGMSYGGFYSLYTAAIDTRIKTVLSSSFFNDRYIYSWIDWTWFKSGEIFGDSDVALLIYPRKLWITVGTEDNVFDINSARNELKRLKKECETNMIGAEWVNYFESDAVHEFCADDAVIDDFIAELVSNMGEGEKQV